MTQLTSQMEDERNQLNEQFQIEINRMKENNEKQIQSKVIDSFMTRSTFVLISDDRDRYEQLLNEKDRLNNVIKTLEEENQRMKDNIVELETQHKIELEKKNRQLDEFKERQDRELEILQEK